MPPTLEPAKQAGAEGLDAKDGLFTSDYLKSLGFTAKTIFDIGVRGGTPELYRAFADRDFILVDPQRGGEGLLKSVPERFRFVNKGLGSAPGELTLNEQGAMSSLLERTALTAGTVQTQYTVEITTIDHLLDTMPAARPIGLKIDTEGFELEVVKGVQKYWSDVEFLICEASVRRRFHDSYQFSDLIAYLQSRGFCFFNILNATVRRPRFYDVLFVRSDSKLLT